MPVVIVCTQALGEPRYPSLKGIMAARSKEIVTRSLADLGIGRGVAGRRRGDDHRPRQPDAAGARGDGGRPRAGSGRRRPDRRLPRAAEAHLMGDLWVVAEPGPDGGLANISAEVATLARELGATSGRDVVGIVVAADPAPAATELATYLPTRPDRRRRGRCRQRLVRGRGRRGSPRCSRREAPDVVFVGAGPDGRDLAGAVSALTGLGVLANATAVAWADAGPDGRDERLRRQAADHVRVHRLAAGS